MMYGVYIDNIDTMAELGLILTAELTIGTPEPRTNYVTVPEADGDLDLTGVLTGGAVRYGMREISFELYPAFDIIAGTRSPATEQHAALIRSRLANLIHGQKHKLWLPDDGNHYFLGRMAVGEKGGYNNTVIPVTMTAEPWRYKTMETVRTITSTGTVTLNNEKKPAQPIFTSTAVATVSFNGTSYQIRPNEENTFDGIVLAEGQTQITITSLTKPVIISYQEATL